MQSSINIELRSKNNQKICCFLILFFISPFVHSNDWTQIIRAIPYSYSQNFHSNLSQIRQWVLFENGFCDLTQRHIFFNNKGVFLGFMDNLNDSQENQNKLNKIRELYLKQNKVKRIVLGSINQTGYPFALNCDQPHVNINESINRLLGRKKEDRLWGTWDGMKSGTEDSPIPLYQLVEKVYLKKSKIINEPVVSFEYRYFLAQIIIESGAQKNGLSKANAIGLLQLKTSVLQDCQIPPKFYRHRMAQVDCAVRLFQQNQRNLRAAFTSKFSHLPKEKQEVIFSLLLVQAYHSGIGRIQNLLISPDYDQATEYFSKHHEKYSAEDIASGIIYHNMGRQNLGFASLYYVIDVIITAEKICLQPQLKEKWFCQ